MRKKSVVFVAILLGAALWLLLCKSPPPIEAPAQTAEAVVEETPAPVERAAPQDRSGDSTPREGRAPATPAPAEEPPDSDEAKDLPVDVPPDSAPPRVLRMGDVSTHFLRALARSSRDSTVEAMAEELRTLNLELSDVLNGQGLVSNAEGLEEIVTRLEELEAVIDETRNEGGNSLDDRNFSRAFELYSKMVREATGSDGP